MWTVRSVSILIAAAAMRVVLGGSFETIERFGANPTGLKMQVYVPEDIPKLPFEPAVLIALHPCGSTGEELYKSTKFAEYADEHKFVVVYPTASSDDGCWGVDDPVSMTHGEGGDSQGIIAMVNYAFYSYGVGQYRAFTMGVGSGGSMTNVLIATYPDVFSGGVVYSGAPHGCFLGASETNQTCVEGKLSHTPEEWGDLARSAYAGFPFARPKMQIWAGTDDDEVGYNNFFENLKQWSNVIGLDLTKNETGVPSEKYTQLVYGDGTRLVGYLAEGLGSNVPVHEEETLQFLGLM